MAVFDDTVGYALDHHAGLLADLLPEKSDIFTYYGPIDRALLPTFKHNLELLAYCNRNREGKPNCLTIFLHTDGGEVEAVDKMVQMIRHHYAEVHFFIPEKAMSAGTIFCMSGDKIYMNYASSLGPIDPQVKNRENKWVPALGYLEQVEKYIQKSANNELTNAEFVLLQNQDIAQLRVYEQANNLSRSLLKQYLVDYKFKSWKQHTDGRPVLQGEKETRAQEVADILADHHRWHTHSRMINMNTLRGDGLRLQIEDFDGNQNLSRQISIYHELFYGCMIKYEAPYMFRVYPANLQQSNPEQGKE